MVIYRFMSMTDVSSHHGKLLKLEMKDILVACLASSAASFDSYEQRDASGITTCLPLVRPRRVILEFIGVLLVPSPPPSRSVHALTCSYSRSSLRFMNFVFDNVSPGGGLLSIKAILTYGAWLFAETPGSHSYIPRN